MSDLSRGRGELGDCLGALRDGMLGELTRKKQTNCGLDLSGRQSCLLGVSRELGGLESETLEDVVDEGVHDGHASLADAGLGMDLLQHLVDVRRVGLNALLVRLCAGLLRGLGGFLSDSRCLGHDCLLQVSTDVITVIACAKKSNLRRVGDVRCVA